MAGSMRIRNFKTLTLISILLIAMPLAFQNCGRMNSSAGDATLSSMQSLSFKPSVQWDMARGNDVTVGRLSQIERWTDRTGKSIVLFPPLSSPNVVNMDRAPIVTQTSSGSLINFGNYQSLALQGGDSLTMVSSKYTVAVYLRNVSPSTGTRVLSLIPSDNSQTGYLGIDIFYLNDDKALIRGFSYFDDANKIHSEVEIPKAALDSGLSILVRFSEDPTKMRLVVNGIQGNVQSFGSPPLLGNVPRALAIHGPDLFVGTFSLAGLSIWKEELDDLQIMTMNQTFRSYYENGGTSTIGYVAQPSPGGGTGNSSITFSSVKANFSSCVSCHDQFGSRSQLMATGWVMAGAASQSKLIKSLRHQTGAVAMPKNQAALSESTIQKIETWINQGAQ